MLSIRLRPVGKKHQRSFRIVVAEKRSKLKGKFVEDLGWYNPHFDKFEIKKEKANYWLSQGAKPTDTVFNLFVSSGLVKGPKRPVHKKAKLKKEGGVIAGKGEEKEEVKDERKEAVEASQKIEESQELKEGAKEEAKEEENNQQSNN